MRYILVNDRTPKDSAYCACCTTKLMNGYPKELSTSLRYCPHTGCYAFHVSMAITAIEDAARRAS